LWGNAQFEHCVQVPREADRVRLTTETRCDAHVVVVVMHHGFGQRMVKKTTVRVFGEDGAGTAPYPPSPDTEIGTRVERGATERADTDRRGRQSARHLPTVKVEPVEDAEVHVELLGRDVQIAHVSTARIVHLLQGLDLVRDPVNMLLRGDVGAATQSV
jgi:hypothetical protein